MSDQIYRFNVSGKSLCVEIDALVTGGATIDNIDFEEMTKTFFVSVTNVPVVNSFMLMETGDFLLLETGDKIIL